MVSKLLVSLLCLFALSAEAAEIEATMAGFFRKYDASENEEELGLGLRGRYARFNSNGYGWFVRFHFDENLVNPELIPCVAKRWGKEFFFEMSAGLYVGTLVDRGITIAAIPTFGYRVSNQFFITLPFYWDLNMGTPLLMEFTPYIGYRF